MGLAHEKLAVGKSGAKATLVVANIRPIWITDPEDRVIDHAGGLGVCLFAVQPPAAIAAIGRQQGGIFGLDLKQDRPQPINLMDELFASAFSQAALAPSLEAGAGELASFS